MSINTTPFLHLPQWTAEEKPSFLAEINQGYASIDAGVRANQVAAEAAQTAAEAAKNQADEAVEQGHTNAAGLVSLQQSLSQLQALFTHSNQLTETTFTFTKNTAVTPDITLVQSRLVYNSFTGNFRLQFKMGAGAYPDQPFDLGYLQGLPASLTFKSLSILASVISADPSEPGFYYGSPWVIDPDGKVWAAMSMYKVTDPAGRFVWLEGTLPVQTLTESSRNSMVDNCLYIRQ